MITPQNFKEIIESSDKKSIIGELDKPHDYIGMWLHIFNTGSYATYESQDYDEDVNAEYSNNGMLFCDKDDFKRLLEQNNIEL